MCFSSSYKVSRDIGATGEGGEGFAYVLVVCKHRERERDGEAEGDVQRGRKKWGSFLLIINPSMC